MKKLVFSAAFSAIGIILSAQAYEGKVEYDKKDQRCLVMEYSFPPLAVENGFILKMEKLGYKGKEEKGMFNKDRGFRVFKGARIDEISDTRMDYIINVNQKSRREEDEAVLYLIISRNGENVMTELNTEEMGKAKAFLYNILPEIEAANLEIQILEQEEIVSKAEKKLRTLKDNREDIEKKIKNLQDDLKDNEKDQEDQVKEIENLKKVLDSMRAKRKKDA